MSTTRPLLRFALLLLVAATCPGQAPAEPAEAQPAAEKPKPAYANAAKYQEVELATLRATPEEYKHKKVCLITTYLGYSPILPWYMELSGFKADKYYWIIVIPTVLPAMTKKTDLMNALIPGLAKRKTVIIYGKVGEYRQKPRNIPMAPSYYLEVDYLEVCAGNWQPELPEEQLDEEILNSKFMSRGGSRGNDQDGGNPQPPHRGPAPGQRR